jgi:Fic family protein
MRDALSAWEKYLHSPSDLPVLVRLALIHYQFEAIHPFEDGNGRIGRLLFTLLMCAEDLLPSPLLYLSAYLERNRKEYYRLLLAVSQSGKWMEWISFILRGVAEQAKDSVRKAGQLLELRDRYRGKVKTVRSSSLLMGLVDQLFRVPAITVTHAADTLGVTYAAAAKHVGKLVEAGILKEVSGHRRNKLFAALEIIKVIED